MLLSSQPSQPSRKFIDMMKRVTGKYANWDPGHSIKPGDYGEIDKNTGGVVVKGNIYEDATMDIFQDEDADIRKLVENNPVIMGTREDKFIATTSNAKGGDLKVDQYGSIPGLAEASIKGRWTFDSHRGALLIIANPQTCYIPEGKLLERLATVKALQKMVLVTQVTICPAFSLYLSSKSNEVVSLALLGSAPIPHAPGATVGGGIEAKWWSSDTTGLYRHGREPNGNDGFTPLYTLKKIRTTGLLDLLPGRGLPDPEHEGDDLWIDAKPPWEPLDEDGNEDPIDDMLCDDSDESDSENE